MARGFIAPLKVDARPFGSAILVRALFRAGGPFAHWVCPGFGPHSGPYTAGGRGHGTRFSTAEARLPFRGFQVQTIPAIPCLRHTLTVERPSPRTLP